MQQSTIYIDAVDTAILCGVAIDLHTLGNREVQARCPYCQDYKYRMYLSRDPDNPTWWCHNCGRGGNAVTMYADYTGLTTKEAFKALIHDPRVKSGEYPYAHFSEAPKLREIKERSNIYLEMLSMLTLTEEHRKNLRQRGFQDDMIDGNLYRSFPTDWRVRQRITDALAARHDLSQMPGFYTHGKQWRMAGQKSGILIPVCDKDNCIQGLQIRVDQPSVKMIPQPDGSVCKKTGGKYSWFSSPPDRKGRDGVPRYPNGTSISSFIHVTGDMSSDTVYLTEGALKADVASYLAGGALFVGLTGVQNTRYLRDVINGLRPKKVVECIDMDLRTNPDVRRAQAKIQSIVMPLCDKYETFYWPESEKGIDDYLLFQKLKQQHLAV